MGRITVVQDLSSAWLNAVKDGKIVNEFKAPADDELGRWSRGELIRFGLCFNDGVITYFARNITTANDIQAIADPDKFIGGSNLVIQFNGFRALRPQKKIPVPGRQPDIPSEVSKCGYYCQNPKNGLSILRRDPFCMVTLPNWKWNVYYNAAPFEEEGHFLLFPIIVDGQTTTIPHFLQKLTREFLEDILILIRNSENLIILFNSLHAGATQNHIHFQAVFHKNELAIEKAQIAECGELKALRDYPACGLVFNQDVEPSKLFEYIEKLQGEDIPFNLFSIGMRIYLIPRNIDQEAVEELPRGTIGSMEMAGKIITMDKSVYDAPDYSKVEIALRKTTIPLDKILSMFQ